MSIDAHLRVDLAAHIAIHSSSCILFLSYCPSFHLMHDATGTQQYVKSWHCGRGGLYILKYIQSPSFMIDSDMCAYKLFFCLRGASGQEISFGNVSGPASWTL